MSILRFVKLKGVVAKTTNAVAVVECLADSGFRTLLIDADHQCMSGKLNPFDVVDSSLLPRCRNADWGNARRQFCWLPVSRILNARTSRAE